MVSLPPAYSCLSKDPWKGQGHWGGVKFDSGCCSNQHVLHSASCRVTMQLDLVTAAFRVAVLVVASVSVVSANVSVVRPRYMHGCMVSLADTQGVLAESNSSVSSSVAQQLDAILWSCSYARE